MPRTSIVYNFFFYKTQFWRVGQPFILRHTKTSKLLHSHDVVLEEEANEVSGFEGTDDNDKWVVSFN